MNIAIRKCEALTHVQKGNSGGRCVSSAYEILLGNQRGRSFGRRGLCKMVFVKDLR